MRGRLRIWESNGSFRDSMFAKQKRRSLRRALGESLWMADRSFVYAVMLTPVVADDVELGVEVVEVKLGRNCCRSDCNEL